MGIRCVRGDQSFFVPAESIEDADILAVHWRNRGYSVKMVW